MNSITITEKDYNDSNLLYVQTVMSELFNHADCYVKSQTLDGRRVLKVDCAEYYLDIIKTEIADKVAEIVAIKYKYEYFKRNVRIGGLSETEKEILMASLIAADLDEDKKYAFDRIKQYGEIAIDGIFNFRLKPLKKKWQDIVAYIPTCFVNSQLKEFVSFLLENKKKRVYIDQGKVYDSHFRRLKRSTLLDGDGVKIVREVLLSNCGEVELSGNIPEDDEFYLKEFYSDKIIFSERYND
jgi:hypothetical protein